LTLRDAWTTKILELAFCTCKHDRTLEQKDCHEIINNLTQLSKGCHYQFKPQHEAVLALSAPAMHPSEQQLAGSRYSAGKEDTGEDGTARRQAVEIQRLLVSWIRSVN
jgi:hypothetical protein